MQAETGTPLSEDPADEPADAAPESGSFTRSRAVLIAVAAAVLVLDLATKTLALARLETGEPVNVLGSFIRFNLIANPGAAFSFGTGVTWLLTAVAIAIVVVLIRVGLRATSRAWVITFGMLIGGALGNIVDRMTRAPGPGQGHVVDFIDYNGYFIGNVADIAIVGGGLLVAILSLRGVGLDGGPMDSSKGAQAGGDRSDD